MAGRSSEDYAIEWVEGDFTRPSTWKPGDILYPGSVDMAVSSLTFQHLVHPLGALQNAMRLLRPGGQVIIDSISLELDPDTADQTAEAIEADLEQNKGGYGFNLNYEPNSDIPHISLRSVHLENRTSSFLENVQPAYSELATRQIVYTVQNES